ncbi:MAG: Ldh family oxidoreductase, partial [Mesorhizobium sp.]
MMQLTLDQATGLCRMAALGAGANEEAAQSLTASIIAAEAEGLSTVGLSHFIDYLEALEA